MQLMSVPRSEVSFNSAILACSRARQWQMTLELFDNLQLSSLEVDVMCLGKVVKERTPCKDSKDQVLTAVLVAACLS